jgi:hypothetical protein
VPAVAVPSAVSTAGKPPASLPPEKDGSLGIGSLKGDIQNE